MTQADTNPLHENLRAAIGAEFTTLPAYLYMYWSIRPASDKGSPGAQAARSSIMTVIAEEMLHMGLACNLLLAVGGTPHFTHAPYLPHYPCNLIRTRSNPTGVGPAVDLLPLSTAAMTMVLGIEYPEWYAPGQVTLGEFYTDNIRKHLPADGPGAYNSARQVQPWNNPGPGVVFTVKDLDSAQHAVDEILHQGEGLSNGVRDDGDNEPAHYWRFYDIQQAITQGSIDLASDVYPVVPKPTAAVAGYSQTQKDANEHFNHAYSRMLDALQAAMSGSNPNVYPVAAAYMRQLHLLADELRLTGPIPNSDRLPGPTFEYIPAT